MSCPFGKGGQVSEETTNRYYFDELAGGLANASISRLRTLKLLGAARLRRAHALGKGGKA